MRFYQQQHEFYCGVDLHARSMHVCIVDTDGLTKVHKNIDATPDRFLPLVRPYREGLVVAAECMFAWYWLADLCAEQQIPFVDATPEFRRDAKPASLFLSNDFHFSAAGHALYGRVVSDFISDRRLLRFDR